MRIILLLVGFLMLTVTGTFAADGATVSVSTPPWLQAILVLFGAGAIGGTSVFASVMHRVTTITGYIQKVKDALNAIIVLLGQVKEIIKTSPIVPDWNSVIDHVVDLLKDLPLGIGTKALLLKTVKITMPVQLPAAPPIVEKIVETIQAMPAAV